MQSGVKMLLSVAYYSKPICAFSDDELTDLWECASYFNERNYVTSGLYYDEQVFFHVLEGESEVIEPLIEMIRRDPRHTDFEIVIENDIASRTFRHWPMKFIDGRKSVRLQEKFAPEAIFAMPVADLNSNAFMMAML